jgi:hypothetical protein
MVNKLTLVRLRTLADALAKASATAERSIQKDGEILDPTIVERILDLEMEVGMILSELEDGQPIWDPIHGSA